MEVTNVQLMNVLNVLNVLYPYLSPKGMTDGEPNKEVVDSAETTFVNACGVIDQIFDDKKRWTCDTADKLAEALEQLYNTQSELNTISTAAVAQANRPSFILKPELTERKPGEWVAQYGKGRNALRGTGDTPHGAMLAFDLAYYDLTQIAAPQQPTQNNGQ
jgi:hypothetical protein